MPAPTPQRHPAGRTCGEAAVTLAAITTLIAALIRKAAR